MLPNTPTLRRFLMLAGAALMMTGAVPAHSGSADAPGGPAPASQTNAARAAAAEEFRMWIDARAGTGEPVHWVSEGGIYEYPSGKKLFGMIGFDSSRVFWPEKPDDPVVHLTRKTYAYTDAETGEILTEYNGQKVEPIAYPYQMITYRYENGRIFGDVEQGVGAGVQKIEAKTGMTWRWMGKDTLAITAPVFLDFPLPNGARYEAWENYDFFIHRPGTTDEPHQMAWQRYGALPPFAGKGQAIYHLLSWRVDSNEKLPEKLREWAAREKPMWLNPPKDIAEIRALQQGKAGEGWAR
ncbi:MAG: DUF1838 family protein [Erythrobacter sp.]